MTDRFMKTLKEIRNRLEKLTPVQPPKMTKVNFIMLKNQDLKSINKLIILLRKIEITFLSVN